VLTRDLLRVRPERIDTLVVAGGDDGPIGRAVADTRLVAYLQRAHGRCRRLASVCSGAFLLAAAGILDGRRATTHWAALDRLARARPLVEVDRTAIFVRAGSVWTSAGVTTGIDMALSMVEDDHGRALADEIAARLVLYVRRPGFQSQFSDALVTQTAASSALAEVLAYARAHPKRVDPAALARRAGMSLRTFHRRCLAELDTTPAKLLESVRVEHARTLLATTRQSAKELAAASGFGNAARMKRAFERVLGLGPREYRLLFDALPARTG
jgi:transcriptional regulator GlxA family with amidase domain